MNSRGLGKLLHELFACAWVRWSTLVIHKALQCTIEAIQYLRLCMLRIVTAATQAPSKPTAHNIVQVQPSVLPRTTMPSLPEPPRQLLPELGRRAVGRSSTAKQLASDGSVTAPALADLPPFACGLTGTSVEVLEPRRCEVEGSVPSWLEGDLYRNGPGVWDVETKGGQVFSLPHWYDPRFDLTITPSRLVFCTQNNGNSLQCRFDGLTVMHKFQITDGKVIYRNRHLNRETEHFIQAKNEQPGIALWSDPCGTLLGRAFSLFKQAGMT